MPAEKSPIITEIQATKVAAPPPTVSKFSRKWSTTFINIFGIVGAIVTILAAIFAVVTAQRKEIAYVVTSGPTKIYDSKNASPAFRVIDANNQQITSDIYVVVIKIWNSGNVAIEPSDVRDNLKMVLFPTQRILEPKTLFEVRPDSAKYAVSNNDVLLSESLLERLRPDATGISDLEANVKAREITWEHLDPSRGLMLQITYVGVGEQDALFHIQLDGDILGIGDFRQGVTDLGWLSWAEPSLFLLYILVIAYLTFRMWRRFIRRFQFQRRNNRWVDKLVVMSAYALTPMVIWVALGIFFFVRILPTIRSLLSPVPPF
jgi:hypothetical protein